MTKPKEPDAEDGKPVLVESSSEQEVWQSLALGPTQGRSANPEPEPFSPPPKPPKREVGF